MLKRDYEGQNCSIARALEIVGERWTLLIVRDVFLGLRRFDQLQAYDPENNDFENVSFVVKYTGFYMSLGATYGF